jgi:phage tail sheath gpL-like
MAYIIQQRFPRCKLAADGTTFGIGNDIITPTVIKAEIIALYDRLIELGLCQAAEQFIEALIVEIDATDPNRVNCLLPVFLVSNLRIFATKVQFRLTV